MKYVVIFALVVAVAQIDTVMKLFRKASSEVSRRTSKMTEQVPVTDIKSESEVVSIDEDPTLHISAYDKIMALLESFKLSPEPELRQRVMEDIKIVPRLLTAPLDPQFETAIYGWRDLLLNSDPETLNFLIELENLTQGANQLMIRKFLSLLLDKNVEVYLTHYIKTRDTNCRGAILFGDPIPDEEKINEWKERDENLSAFQVREGVDERLKAFANLCQLVIRAQLTPSVPTPTPAPGPEGQVLVPVPVNQPSPTVTP